MRTIRYVLIIYFSLGALTGCAQVEVLSVEKLTLPEAGAYYHPRLDDTGRKILLTAENYKGLLLYDSETSQMKQISEGEGAGYSPVLSGDGKTLLYVENEYIKNLRHSKLMAYRMESGETVQLEKPVRSLSVPMVAGNKVLYKADNQLKSAEAGPGSADPQSAVMAAIEEQKLVVYRNGTGQVLTPYEGDSYIWPSVSPDQTRILAFAMGRGTFICNPEGMILAEFGKIEAPVWAGNRHFAGMMTTDDGHRITSSKLVMVDTETGKKTILTPEGIVALYPSVSAVPEKIVFHSPEGEVYLLQYHVRR